MTSKEALKNIKDTTTIKFCVDYKEHLSVIEKDLERLEKLEKFFKLCFTKYAPLTYFNPNEWISKNAYLETMNYDFYLDHICAEDICGHIIENKDKLTLEEFNFMFGLVKEVLGNE